MYQILNWHKIEMYLYISLDFKHNNAICNVVYSGLDSRTEMGISGKTGEIRIKSVVNTVLLLIS